MATATTSLWAVDPAHSEIQFTVKHLVISTVTGNFNVFDGYIKTEEADFEGGYVYFEAHIDSIFTNNGNRDEHLKSEDFFDAVNYPKLTFQSTSFKKTGNSEYNLTGHLTIRDTTKEVELDVNHGGIVEDAYGNTKTVFEASGTINRKEFGIIWSASTEAGNVVIGDEIHLMLNVQLTKK